MATEPSGVVVSDGPGEEPGAAAWLGAGLGVFGLALGLITGLSTQTGISGTFLGSLFSFVGGVLLSYAGFSRRLRAGGNSLSSVRVGSALLAFSLGVIVGTVGGITLRQYGPRVATAGGQEPGFILHALSQSDAAHCVVIGEHVNNASISETTLREDLRWITQTTNCK